MYRLFITTSSLARIFTAEMQTLYSIERIHAVFLVTVYIPLKAHSMAVLNKHKIVSALEKSHPVAAYIAAGCRQDCTQDCTPPLSPTLRPHLCSCTQPKDKG